MRCNGSKTLMKVLHDQVSGEWAHPEWLQPVFYPLMCRITHLVLHWLSTLLQCAQSPKFYYLLLGYLKKWTFSCLRLSLFSCGGKNFLGWVHLGTLNSSYFLIWFSPPPPSSCWSRDCSGARTFSLLHRQTLVLLYELIVGNLLLYSVSPPTVCLLFPVTSHLRLNSVVWKWTTGLSISHNLINKFKLFAKDLFNSHELKDLWINFFLIYEHSFISWFGTM